MTHELEDTTLFPCWVHVMLPVEAMGRFDVWTGMLSSMKRRVDTRADALEKKLGTIEDQLTAIAKALAPVPVPVPVSEDDKDEPATASETGLADV